MRTNYVNFDFQRKSLSPHFRNAQDFMISNALKAIKRDGLPDVGSDEIRLHHHEENGTEYPNDKRTASFRMGTDHSYALTLHGWNEDNGWVDALVLNLHDGKVLGTLSNVLAGLSDLIVREDAFCQRATAKQNADGLNATYMVAARQKHIETSMAAQEYATTMLNKLRQCYKALPIDKATDNSPKWKKHAL